MLIPKPLFNGQIHWPDDINEQHFLEEYWQQKPLLLRQAFPGFKTPLPADELAGLSLEPGSTGRLIIQDENDHYHLEHGPFDEQRFANLTDNNWSLLVTDIEKHLPEFVAYLQPFRFIPDWRIDDLMISYAPDGASVGAHIDEYDVFLLQGSGTRIWSIDARADTQHKMRSEGDLKILANFDATHTWELVAGDMLYLPPSMAHHGVAKGDDCTTWSVGFRAPRLPEFIMAVAESVSDAMGADRYTDGKLQPAKRGEICHTSIQRFKQQWEQATRLDDARFAQLLGQWLTQSNAIDPPQINNTDLNLDRNSSTELCFEKAPYSQFAWIDNNGDMASLFVDGEHYFCSKQLAERICHDLQYVCVLPNQLNDDDARTMQALIKAGSLDSTD